MTAAESQGRIIREVGDPNGTLRVAVGALWSANSSRPDELQYLYTKRAAIDVRLAEEQARVDLALGTVVNRRESQIVDHLQQMRTDVQAEIVRIEGIARQSRGPVTGKLTTVTPLTPRYPAAPDAADPYYAGSPYGRRYRDT